MDKFRINITPDDIKPIACSNCGSLFFTPALGFGRLSPLKSASGKEEIVQVANLIVCISCGTQLDPEAEQTNTTNQETKEGDSADDVKTENVLIFNEFKKKE